MNVPFVPVRGLLHTDYMTVRPDFKAVPNPYDPREEIAIVPSLAPDVAVFHGFRGDRFGNVISSGERDARDRAIEPRHSARDGAALERRPGRT